MPDSDCVAEAATIAKAINGRAPVKLIWTREDDMAASRYRPMSYHIVEGALDGDGNISAWRHRLAVQSIMAGTPFEGMIENGLDPMSVEGSRCLPYTIPNLQVDLATVEGVGAPVLWWRSVGYTHNGYVTEAFFDELAASAGSFTVDKVTCAVDCGIAINPDVIRAQMEGGIGCALSAALREEVTLAAGEVEQQNFDGYRPLRIDEVPEVEVHIAPSGEAPTGVGEPGVPPLAPALVNALADEAGKRVYRLPIGGAGQGVRESPTSPVVRSAEFYSQSAR